MRTAQLWISFTAHDEDGDDIEHMLPAKYEVCSNCEGTGTHLREGMRGHAYTAEEMSDFDDEERAEYFKPGGIYDVPCDTCKGERVEKVIDESACETDEQKESLQAYYDKIQRDHDDDAESRAERRMGC